eukprot:19102-Heterococcus_DN1.PRE.1
MAVATHQAKSESNVYTAYCMLSITAAATTGTNTVDNAANLVEDAYGDQTDDSEVDTSIKIESNIIQEDITIINTEISNGSDIIIDIQGTNNIAYNNEDIIKNVDVDIRVDIDDNPDSQNDVDINSNSVHDGEVNLIEVDKLDDTANKDIIPDETEVDDEPSAPNTDINIDDDDDILDGDMSVDTSIDIKDESNQTTINDVNRSSGHNEEPAVSIDTVDNKYGNDEHLHTHISADPDIGSVHDGENLKEVENPDGSNIDTKDVAQNDTEVNDVDVSVDSSIDIKDDPDQTTMNGTNEEHFDDVNSIDSMINESSIDTTIMEQGDNKSDINTGIASDTDMIKAQLHGIYA